MMNRKTLSSLLVLTMLPSTLCFAETTDQLLGELASGTLKAAASTQTVRMSVERQNAKSMALSDIQALDKEWMATPGISDRMKELMQNDCGKEVSALLESKKYLTEVFVMDNQGALVCMSDKTSDYWQGDEEKFTKSFADGKGAVFIDEVKFDESTQTYSAQVSIPVMKEDSAIGAVTFGVDVDSLEKERQAAMK